jgi:hypothetical protein
VKTTSDVSLPSCGKHSVTCRAPSQSTNGHTVAPHYGIMNVAICVRIHTFCFLTRFYKTNGLQVWELPFFLSNWCSHGNMHLSTQQLDTLRRGLDLERSTCILSDPLTCSCKHGRPWPEADSAIPISVPRRLQLRRLCGAIKRESCALQRV